MRWQIESTPGSGEPQIVQVEGIWTHPLALVYDRRALGVFLHAGRLLELARTVVENGEKPIGWRLIGVANDILSDIEKANKPRPDCLSVAEWEPEE